ncbi:MAG TPA: RNA polymerase sigma factor [Thermoanaerobaculia bacterium]|jgi:RNA polymerase sigma-70 factor (ECF subfamily)
MQADSNPLPLAILDDETVIRRVKQGEIALFEIVMRRYNQRLYRIIRSILGTDSDVEDVIQETYLKAYGHLAQFEGRSSFATWLTKIAVYEAVARARKGRRFQPLEVTVGDDESRVAELRSALPDPEQNASRHEIRRLIEEAVDHLPDIFREVFVMREIEQMSQAETAECLGLKEETVKTRLHRARRQIETHLLTRAGEGIRTAYSFGDSRCTRVVTTVLHRIAEGRVPGV